MNLTGHTFVLVDLKCTLGDAHGQPVHYPLKSTVDKALATTRSAHCRDIGVNSRRCSQEVIRLKIKQIRHQKGTLGDITAITADDELTATRTRKSLSESLDETS